MIIRLPLFKTDFKDFGSRTITLYREQKASGDQAIIDMISAITVGNVRNNIKNKMLINDTNVWRTPQHELYYATIIHF